MYPLASSRWRKYYPWTTQTRRIGSKMSVSWKGRSLYFGYCCGLVLKVKIDDFECMDRAILFFARTRIVYYMDARRECLKMTLRMIST
jgi:hypothetical protein